MRDILRNVKNTLDLYDPSHMTVVMGSAALALQGIKVPGGVPDVDTLSAKGHIDDLDAGLRADNLGDTSYRDSRTFPKDPERQFPQAISLVPNATAQLDGIMPYQSFTESIDERYDIDYFRAYARSLDVDGYRCLPVGDILDWKATVGREKDIEKVSKILSKRSIRNYITKSQKQDLRDKIIISRRRLAERPRRGGYFDPYISDDLITSY